MGLGDPPRGTPAHKNPKTPAELQTRIKGHANRLQDQEQQIADLKCTVKQQQQQQLDTMAALLQTQSINMRAQAERMQAQAEHMQAQAERMQAQEERMEVAMQQAEAAMQQAEAALARNQTDSADAREATAAFSNKLSDLHMRFMVQSVTDPICKKPEELVKLLYDRTYSAIADIASAASAMAMRSVALATRPPVLPPPASPAACVSSSARVPPASPFASAPLTPWT